MVFLIFLVLPLPAISLPPSVFKPLTISSSEYHERILSSHFVKSSFINGILKSLEEIVNGLKTRRWKRDGRKRKDEKDEEDHFLKHSILKD